MLLVVTDDQQAQQSGSCFFPNAQRFIVNGGSFIVSLCCRCVCDLVPILGTEQCL